MATAQGSRSQLIYSTEDTFGTSPGGNYTTLPFNSHSISLKKTSLESAEIRSDRQIDIYRHGMQTVEGDIEVDFRADDFDSLLESALFSTWDSDLYLRAGTTQKFFSMEDGALDIANYAIYTGMEVNTFSMSVQPDAIVTATFGMMGKTMTSSGSSLDSTPTAVSGNQPFDGNNFISTIKEGGTTIALLTSIEFTLENGVVPSQTIGATSAAEHGFGRSRCTGSITARFQNTTLLNKFINETESELEFTLTDGVSGNDYRFWFPRIKYNGGDIPVQSEDFRNITLPFIALRDSVELSQIVIQKP